MVHLHQQKAERQPELGETLSLDIPNVCQPALLNKESSRGCVEGKGIGILGCDRKLLEQEYSSFVNDLFALAVDREAPTA